MDVGKSNQQLSGRLRSIGCFFFFTSGATALMYEIVWLRLLGLIFGNTTYAISTVLAVFMAGLGLGSFLAGRLADQWHRPLFVYGCLELIIALFAAFTLPIVAFTEIIYVGLAQKFNMSIGLYTTLRFFFSLCVMLVPTICMGATLPILAKFYVRAKDRIGSDTARLYGLNTAGAVLGTIVTGFWLLNILGVQKTLFVAVAINTSIGLLACALGRHAEEARAPASTSPPSPGTSNTPRQAWSPASIFTGLVLSGIAAMMYEVSWTRVLGAVLGSSTFGFTIMLATFLVGMATGSATFERILRTRNASMSLWAWLQCAAALAALLTLPLFDDLNIPLTRIYAATMGHFMWFQFGVSFLCGMIMFVPAFCFGAAFPVAVSVFTDRLQNLPGGIGKLYLANTCGNVIGSLAAGFLLISCLGIHHTILAGAILGSATAVAFLYLDSKRETKSLIRIACFAGVAILLCLSSRGGWNHKRVTAGFHVNLHSWSKHTTQEALELSSLREILFYKEGLSSIVNVEQSADTTLLRVNGKVDASDDQDMRTQVLLGHLPLLARPQAEEALIVGMGSGVTLAATLCHPVNKVDCVEIEPAVVEAAPFFRHVNRNAYEDERANILINDGRNHLLVSSKQYDVIISEPSNPWIAGVANLFSAEYYNLIRDRLTDGGLLCQWLQAYSISPEDYRMVVATLHSVFPYVSLWAGVETDTLILASDAPIIFDLDLMKERFKQSSVLREDLEPFMIYGPGGLFASFLLGHEDVASYVKDVPRLNTDDKLYLEFSAPRSLYHDATEVIARGLNSYRTQNFPNIRTRGKPIPKDPRFLRELGLAFMDYEDNPDAQQRALRCLRTSVAAGESSTRSVIGLSRYYIQSGSPSEAAKLLEDVIASSPTAEAIGYLGIARLEQGQVSAALTLLEKAIEMNADTAREFQTARIKALEKLERWKEAADACAEIESRNADYAKVRVRRIRNLRKAGDYGEAAWLGEQLRTAYTQYYPVYDELRKIYLIQGHRTKAIALYEELVKRNPHSLTYWMYLAQLYDDDSQTARLTWAKRQGKNVSPYFEEMLAVAKKADENVRREELKKRDE